MYNKNLCWKIGVESSSHCSSKSQVYLRSMVTMLGLASLPHMSYKAKPFIPAEDLAQHVSFLVTKLIITIFIWWNSCKFFQSHKKKVPNPAFPGNISQISLPNIPEADEGDLQQRTS